MSLSKEKLLHIANAVELLQTTLKCVICMDMLREPVSTRCGHYFCTLCLNNLLSHKKNGRATCPLCSAVVSRRGIVQNNKIRRQVDGVIQLIKAIESDTSMDVTVLRQTPSSTNEANSPVHSLSTSRNKNRNKITPMDGCNSKEVEDGTPEKSPPPKISSAEKVKTWLIQNNNDFESRNVLNEFTHPRKPPVCDEDSDNDMISVSQVVNEPRTNVEPVKSISESVKNLGKQPVRRSLKIKKINQLTSGKASKSTDEAFDKLLDNTIKTTVCKPLNKLTVPKTAESSQGEKKMSLSNDNNINLSRDNVETRNPKVVLELLQPCDLNAPGRLARQSNKNDAHASIHDKTTEEYFPLDKERPEKLSSTVKSKAQQSKKLSTESHQTQSTVSSVLDSCEVLPSIECDVVVPLLNLKHAQEKSNQAKATEKAKFKVLNSKKGTLNTAKRVLDQKLADPIRKKPSTSPVSVAFVKAGPISQTKKCNVRFVQYGRVLRERRFVPLDIRCHCVDKPMFLVDLNEEQPKIPSVFATPKGSKAIRAKETHTVGVQTASIGPETGTADDNAMDTASEDMFPVSPVKTVSSGGEIVSRRSNSSSVGSDILDAVTVVFSQQPAARNCNSNKMDSTLLEPEKSLLQSPSESLLTKPTEESKKAYSNEEEAFKKPESDVGKSDSDEELVGARARKCAKRPRRLSSSDDSEDGEKKIGRKKKKNLSDSDDTALPPPLAPSFLDQTLESPSRLVEGIKAKIAAGMLSKTDENGRTTSPRSSSRTPRISRQASASKLVDIDLSTPSRKKPSSDSDTSDCELLEGTPQNEAGINTLRRSLRREFAEESFSVKAVAPSESCTPGFVEPSQPPFEELPVKNCDSKKSEVKTSGRNSVGKDVRETVSSPGARRGRTEKAPTPQRPLREKNTTEEKSANRTLNNTSDSSGLLEKKKEATLRSVQRQPSKSPIPKKTVPANKFGFVCSGLPGNFTALVQKLAVLVGADFSSKFDAKTTHLVVKTKEDNTTDKTLKYLCAVAAKKWVVSIQWVVEGIKEGKLLPEEKFEVLDSTGAEGPRLSRLSPKLLFSEFEFCIFPPLSDITKQQLKELVQMCGATVVSDPKKFSHNPDVLPLCLAEYDEDREQEYLGWIDRYCVPLVQHEWILECIGRFCLLSFWSLLMSDVSDESLRSMGYPAYLIEHPPSDSTEME